MQRLLLPARDKRWKLHQPGGGIGGQSLNEGMPCGAAAELSQRLEDRVVRFLASETFDTLTPCEAQAPTLLIAEQELLNNPSFADAWLTGNEDNLPLPG